MSRLAMALAASSLALVGCATLAPKYVRPEPPVPATWPQGPAYAPNTPAAGGADAADLDWRDVFTDPKLRQVIEAALHNNRDLRVAILNVAHARAQYRVQRAALLPVVTANAAYSYQYSLATTSNGAVAESAGAKLYGLTANISAYELDLFGRVRSLTRAALERYLMTEEASAAVRISLISQVADSYLTLAADRARLAVSKNTLTAQQAAYDLVRSRVTYEVASDLDLRQAETGVDTARSSIEALTTQCAQDLNALNLLVGDVVEEDLLPAPLSDMPSVMSDPPANVSAAVLLQRPDVQQAEHELRADNANIGAARAAFFPALTLTASDGAESPQLSSLFKSVSGAWSFAPNLGLPIFDWGANKGRLDAAKVQQKIAVAEYEKAIQTAFREIADALARRGTINAQLAADQANAAAAKAALDLTQLRYRRGVDPYLNTLLAQQAFYVARQTEISSEVAFYQNRVELYRALGGGRR